MKKTLELKRYRDFDQTIDVSFRFFKHYLKPIALFLWKNNRILLSALLMSYFVYNYYATLSLDFDAIFKQTPKKQDKSPLSLLITFVFYILSFVFYIRLLLTVFGFVKSHIKHKGKVVEEEVKEVVSGQFWHYFFATFFLLLVLFFLAVGVVLLYMLMIFAGSFVGAFLGFFLLIGFVLYLIIFAHLFYYIIFVENLDVIEAASMAMRYIKERFWYVMGVMFVMAVIIVFFSTLFNYPLIVFLLGKFILAFDSHEFAISTPGTILFSFYATVSFAAEAVLRVLLIITTIVTYYSIREARTAEAVYEKIDSIGKTDESQIDQINI